jgi:class 3 adenylate cyclase
VLEALRQRPFQIPAILMTSHGSEEIAVQVFRLGVRDYIIKPFKVDEILESMEKVMFEVQLRREKAALTNQLMQANQQLKQRLTELNTLYQVGKSVTALMPLDALLGRITDAALYITRAEEGVLMLNDPETGRLKETVSKRRHGQGIRPIKPRDTDELEPPGKTAAMLYIPLQVGSKEIGVLGVNNKNSLRTFSDHDKQMLRILTDYAAIAIENVRLLHQVEKSKEQEKRQIQNLFERYVAPPVVKELLNKTDEVALGGTRQTVSVLFADIRGFTRFSTQHNPEMLVEVLNRYITVAAKAILDQEGTLDKFMGDAVMAFFNAPLPQPDYALRAVRAASTIQRAIAVLHRKLPPPLRLRFGIGVSVGEAVVGNIGTPQMMNYTIIGEAVNKGQRLQARAKGGQTLICQNTFQLVRDHVKARPLGTVELKGLPASHVFELLE